MVRLLRRIGDSLKIARPIGTGQRELSRIGGNLKPLFAGATWIAFGTALGQLLKLASSAVVARTLSTEEFGQLAIIQNTVNMYTVFSGLGLGITTAKFVSEFREQQPERAGAVVALAEVCTTASGIGLALVTVVLAGPLSSTVLHAPELKEELYVGAALLLLTTIQMIQLGTLAGLHAFKQIAALTILQGLSTLVLSAVGAAAWGVLGVLYGLLGSILLTFAVGRRWQTSILMSSCININYKIWSSELKPVATFAFPALIAGTLASPCLWAVQTLLVRQSNGYIEMALFNAAYQWRLALMFLPSVASKVALPILSEMIGRDQSTHHTMTTRATLYSITSATALAAIAIALCSNIAMGLYGRQYQGAKALLVILLMSGVVSSANSIYSIGLGSAGKMWSVLQANLTWAFVALGTAVVWVPAYKAVGLAVSLLVAECLSTYVVKEQYKRHFATTSSSAPGEQLDSI